MTPPQESIQEGRGRILSIIVGRGILTNIKVFDRPTILKETQIPFLFCRLFPRSSSNLQITFLNFKSITNDKNSWQRESIMVAHQK